MLLVIISIISFQNQENSVDLSCHTVCTINYKKRRFLNWCNGKNVVVGLKFKGSKAKLNDAINEGFCIAENNNSLTY